MFGERAKSGWVRHSPALSPPKQKLQQLRRTRCAARAHEQRDGAVSQPGSAFALSDAWARAGPDQPPVARAERPRWLTLWHRPLCSQCDANGVRIAPAHSGRSHGEVLGPQGLVAGAGAVLEGGVVGVVAGGCEGCGLGALLCEGCGLGALLGVFSEVVVVGDVALLAKSSQAPTARRATTIRMGSTLQLASSVRGI